MEETNTSPASSDRPGEVLSHDSFFRNMVDNLQVAIYTCDIHGYITWYNKAAVKLWGRAPEIGKDLWCGSWKIFDAEGNPMLPSACPIAITLKEGRSVRGIEIIIERPDEKRINVLPHPDPLYNAQGKMIGAVNMLVDITEHKQTRDTNLLLNHYNSQLEEFAYAASHDLQEPLRKIHTFSSMLLDRHTEQLDDKGTLYLVKITETAGRMNSLIQDLLDFSKETRPDAVFAVTDLNAIVENINSDLELLIASKQAIIDVDPLPVVRAIPSQMNRLFYNLLQNSLKFSKPDVPPVISISISDKLVEGEDGRLYIEFNFSDNGIGFEQKDSEKIFQLFHRLNDRHSFSGNGIGLALCKKIIENHEGTISATSEPGKGSVFTFTLPVDRVFIG